MQKIRIYILDNKGKCLGREYDYEYGGRAREAGRATQPRRRRRTYLSIAGFVFALGLWPLVSAIFGSVEPQWGKIFIIFGGFGIFAALLLWNMRMELKKRDELYEVLAKASPGGRSFNSPFDNTNVGI